MAMIFKGSEVVEALNERITNDADELKKQGIEPTLAILRVGERDDDITYEKGATTRAKKVGVTIKNVVLPLDVTEDALINEVLKLNADDSVHGVLMFRPLPEHIDEDKVRNMLTPAKDIDGVTDLSLAGVFAGIDTGFAPCTAAACMEILDYFDVDCKGKNAVVVGRSLVIGKPAAMMLLERNATVTIAHSRTADLPAVVRNADIVIAAVGRFRMLDASYFTEGQVVIDVGINFNDDGDMAGDVDFEAVEGIVQAITPVPGGVGTVTTSVLMKHVVEAAQRSTN
ncbi:MAG: bifunctional 5,10-methylenetetrahydrofolate dehydrogenase/5,10-methenyltetrahydrofolate cyclohydrolase [Coriobacteriia bacterium]|nr:bifunctional 5,10-methylenetetrahydrofolate dehydrogenase/5,10-methenyltetrahydrofolate cyclohydrolase [Coriobacteriia bacterium]